MASKAKSKPARGARSKPRTVAVTDLEPFQWSFQTGSKWQGGFGPTELIIPDYWTLRQRSAQLFTQNLYARGIIRRLVINEINIGLHVETTPEEVLLGRAEDSLSDWSENVENRFQLWADDAELCDAAERLTFGRLQALARLESLVAGDVLVVMRQDQRTKLPRIQLVNGASVQTPLGAYAQGFNQIKHGVEIDSNGRHVAFHVRQEDGTSKRLPAFGEKSGRRLAWLVYGTDKRLDDVRGTPLLALILQSLREIDRYRDATQRKALINSIIAMWVKKDVDKPGSKLVTRSATRNAKESTVDTVGKPRRFSMAEQIPGLAIEELQVGEEPVPYSTNGTDQAFGEFEASIIAGCAWALNIPPEILILSFRSNYSASQAAINEFKTYLNFSRTEFGESFCKPIYVEWLLAETLNGKVDAQGLLESWRDFSQYDIFGAWTSCDWSGAIKPAVDLSKLVAGYKEMLSIGAITYDRAARELSGTKFTKNIKKIEREVLLIAKALKPLAELEALKKAVQVANPDAPNTPPKDGGKKKKPKGSRATSALALV